MKKTVFIALSILFLNSCSSKSSSNNEVVSVVAADDQSEAELKASMKEFEIEEAIRLKEEAESRTSISFDKMVHDYGNVKPDSDNATYFTINNTGKKPLIIENVEASCGCTTPEKPKKPILPGKSDRMKVSFHPKPGQVGEIDKKVTVTSNTEPMLTVLTIKSFVK